MRLGGLRMWHGEALPAGLQARLQREYRRLALVEEQLRTLRRLRSQQVGESAEPALAQVRQLMRLRGVGEQSAWLFVMEFFAWRAFRNRREVGALAGLTPTPYGSGGTAREQGISKAGNTYVRGMAVEIAWGWLRHQPESELTQWYERKFGQGSKRLRKIGIVALARRLLILFWRYLETGALPAGTHLKEAPG